MAISFSVRVKEELEKVIEQRSRRQGKKRAGAAGFSPEAEDIDAIRLLFLSGGTVSDPKRSYHLEINCGEKEAAKKAASLLSNLEVAAKIHRRRSDWCVYIKEADSVARLLGLMGASGAMMELENERILHDISGQVNRHVNCETANQNKTIKASLKQLQTIEILEKYNALKTLPAELYELAILRRDNIDVPLKDLGQMLSVPLGKSGTFHRFARIEKIAKELERED